MKSHWAPVSGSESHFCNSSDPLVRSLDTDSSNKTDIHTKLFRKPLPTQRESRLEEAGVVECLDFTLRGQHKQESQAA